MSEISIDATVLAIVGLLAVLLLVLRAPRRQEKYSSCDTGTTGIINVEQERDRMAAAKEA